MVKHKNSFKNSKGSSVFVGHKKSAQKAKHKRKRYTEQDLEHALKALKTGASIKKTASVYGIPCATLFRKYKNPEKKKPGPSSILGETVERYCPVDNFKSADGRSCFKSRIIG